MHRFLSGMFAADIDRSAVHQHPQGESGESNKSNDEFPHNNAPLYFYDCE